MNYLPQNNYIEIFGDLKEDMRFLVSSDVRSKILLSLHESPKILASLRKELDYTSSTILHAMYQLDEKNLILKKSGVYSLSQIGEVVVLKLINIMNALNSIQKLENMFLNHNTTSIPSYLLHRLECLEKSYIIESTSQDLIKPYNTLKKLISKSKEIKILSSIFYPIYEDILKENSFKGNIQFIVSPEVLENILKNYKDLIITLSRNNLLLYELKVDVKIFLIDADNFLSMGLFSTDGTYDSSRFLFAESKDALKWGNHLLKYYLNQSYPVKL